MEEQISPYLFIFKRLCAQLASTYLFVGVLRNWCAAPFSHSKSHFAWRSRDSWPDIEPQLDVVLVNLTFTMVLGKYFCYFEANAEYHSQAF